MDRKNDGRLHDENAPGRAAFIAGCLLIAAMNGVTANAESAPTKVYECLRNEQRVFSDQPCAADAKQREISASNRMSAQETEIHYRASAVTGRVKSKQQKVTDNDADSRQQRCSVLQGDKDSINSRMRAGYKNDEGERLRARLRKIDSEYYQLRCQSSR